MADPAPAESRESRIVDAFVDLTDTLVTDFDVVEFFHRLIDRALPLLDIDAAGILLDGREGLRVVAASNEDMAILELFELQNNEGPCYDAYQTGETVLADDLESAVDRWPRFARKAVELGFRSGHAVPLRLRDQKVGAFNLFSRSGRSLGDRDAKLVRGLADVATIALLQERSIADAERTSGQLQTALDSRVIIEQAKGRIAERAGCPMNEAFDRVRSYARSHNRRLSEVSADVVSGGLTIDEIMT